MPGMVGIPRNVLFMRFGCEDVANQWTVLRLDTELVSEKKAEMQKGIIVPGPILRHVMDEKPLN